ncbi:bacteriohemerythrin [Telmatospirillum sp.]|uniref:bacteriohemerythrin n=1 Tax=Telmatospirillum sp. TaxID=2079197 RepID=UPI002851F31E|nr:bacteriohemerythrin [Telmatospirillum sp.]MDR3435199.1 bacteriohemerythrin [Telmatospirillum sp.]
MQISWKVEYSLGIAEMDAEHVRMIEMMARLESVDGRPDALRTVGKVINDLVDYVGTHFMHEEDLMEKAGYPHLERHREQHRVFAQKVYDMRSRASLDAHTVHQFLQQWLGEHILKADRDYVPYVQRWLDNRGAEGGLE